MKPFAESRRIYQRDGRFYEMGETFVQPELAAVLARIKSNPRDFYEGETAKLIVADMKANGGIITARRPAHVRADDPHAAARRRIAATRS